MEHFSVGPGHSLISFLQTFQFSTWSTLQSTGETYCQNIWNYLLFAKKVHQSMFYVFSKIWLTRYRAVCWPFSYNKENNLSTGLSSPRQRWKWEFQEFGFVFILWILIHTSLDFNYVKPRICKRRGILLVILWIFSFLFIIGLWLNNK